MGQHEISQTKSSSSPGQSKRNNFEPYFILFNHMANKKMVTETAGNYNLLILKKEFYLPNFFENQNLPLLISTDNWENGKIYKKQT